MLTGSEYQTRHASPRTLQTPPRIAIDENAICTHHGGIYGASDAGWLAVWHCPADPVQPKPTTWTHVSDVDAVIAAHKRYRDGNLYVGVGLHPAPLGEYSRGNAAGVRAIPGLFADIDIGGIGHKNGNRPPDAAAAWRLIRAAVPLPPSYIVGSGGGLHCHWLFKELWCFADEGERRHAERLNRMLQWLIVAEARKHGWLVDSLPDISRVLRFAGSVNRKPGVPERPVTILQGVRQRYSVEDLERVLPLDDPAFRDRDRSRERPPTTRGPSRAPAALWGRISAQCAYLSHCEHDAPTLSEPEWHGMMTVLGRCHNGEAIAHRVSSDYPGYDPSETQRKFDYALTRDNPMRCSTIRYERGGEPWCSGCPFWERITSPIQLGYAPGYRYAPAVPAGQETAA